MYCIYWIRKFIYTMLIAWQIMLYLKFYTTRFRLNFPIIIININNILLYRGTVCETTTLIWSCKNRLILIS